MSYSLLWIEALVISLLWVATWVACAAHLSRKWVSRATAIMIALVPFLVLGALAAVSAWLRFGLMLDLNWFGYTLSLFTAYVICGVALLIIATRKNAPANSWAAAEWPRGKLAAGLLTATAVGAMTLWNMDLEARSQAGLIQLQAGALMLEVSPPNVSDSHNAALIYDKAFARLDADKSLEQPDSVLADETPDVKSKAVLELLDRHALTIKLLRQATTLTDCRFEHDYARPSISMLLPELNKARTAANILRLHVRSELSQGHVESALIDVNSLFHLSRCVGTEPIIVSFLVSLSVQQIASRTLEQALPAVSKQVQLKGLEMGDADDDVRMVVRSFQGEEAFGLSIFGDLGSGRMTLAEMESLSQAVYSSAAREFVPNSAVVLLRVFFLSDDVRAYRDLLDGYEQAAKQPYFKIRDEALDLEQVQFRTHRQGLVTSIIVPALSRVLKSAARSQAIHSATRVGVASTRYRLDHGTLPTTLVQLVPDYLDEIPVDPFDGKSLRLSQKPDEWTVYSVGPDGKDDSGMPYDSKSEKGDLTFTLRSGRGARTTGPSEPTSSLP
jgi:hypothetical protein